MQLPPQLQLHHTPATAASAAAVSHACSCMTCLQLRRCTTTVQCCRLDSGAEACEPHYSIRFIGTISLMRKYDSAITSVFVGMWCIHSIYKITPQIVKAGSEVR